MQTRPIGSLPDALSRVEEIGELAAKGPVALFLDYDGTLAPIAKRPALAVLPEAMRETVRTLARLTTVAVVSGRDLEDVRRLVALDSIYYAGSHGYDIAGPKARPITYQTGEEFLPALDRAESALRRGLDDLPGVLVERKRFSISVHYRLAPARVVGDIEAAVDAALARETALMKTFGKKLYELQPPLDWHKGKAVLWLLDTLRSKIGDATPVYIGDDITDENALAAIADRGIGIVVGRGERRTAARYALQDPDAVRRFLVSLAERLTMRR